MPQKQKLSLAEARKFFAKKAGVKEETASPRGKRNKARNSGPKKRENNFRRTDNIQQKIRQLEKKIQHDDLSEEEENAVIVQIGELEAQLKR